MLVKTIKKKNRFGYRITHVGIIEEKEPKECFNCGKEFVKGEFLCMGKTINKTYRGKLFCLECSENLDISHAKIMLIGFELSNKEIEGGVNDADGNRTKKEKD